MAGPSAFENTPGAAGGTRKAESAAGGAGRSNRRKDARRPCRIPVILENLEPLPSEVATLYNFSRYGLYIEANQRHPAGAQLFVGIEQSPYNPSRRRKHECHCVFVKWRRQLYSTEYLYGYGLEHRDPPCSCRRDYTVPFYEEDFVCEIADPDPEQRKHPRRRFRKTVYFNAGGGTRQGMVGNISRSGVFIETPLRFQVGRPVKLVIPSTRLAGRNALRGRIVRLANQGIGIKFTGLLTPKTGPGPKTPGSPSVVS